MKANHRTLLAVAVLCGICLLTVLSIPRNHTIRSVSRVQVETPAGTAPVLPWQVRVTYADRTREWRQVRWSGTDREAEAELASRPAGSVYRVQGFILGDNATEEGYPVKAEVTVVADPRPGPVPVARPLPLRDVRLTGDNRLTGNRDRDVRQLLSLDVTRMLYNYRDTYGLSYVKGEKREALVNSVWCWGKYYEEILNRIFDKSLQAEYNNSDKALNYYWGMSAGVVDVWCDEKLQTPTRRLVDFLKESIKQNICIPFLTPLTTQSGEVIGEDSKSLTLEQIINMDYLVDNVIGEIPKYDELSPMGKATVDTAGIEKSQNDIVKEAEKKAGDEK